MGHWKDILKEASSVKDYWSFRVGNGTGVRFWMNTWVGSSTLRLSFHKLLEVAVNKSESGGSVGPRCW